MLTPPAWFDAAEAIDVMARCFSAPDAPLIFSPAGEDSWNFRYGDFWLSLRRDLRGHSPRAYEMAAILERQGCNFVIAPLAASDGTVVHSLSSGPMVVFAYRELETCEHLPMSAAEGAEAITMLEAIHAAEPLSELPVEDFSIPFAADVEHAIEVSQGRYCLESGPLADRLAILLRSHSDMLSHHWQECRTLARSCKAEQGAAQITHGEPIAANFARCGGRLMIGDFGDLALGPPERDWVHLRRTTCARPAGRENFLRFYETRWVLSEIAEYTSTLMQPHSGSADDVAMFGRLLRYMPESVR
jgi:spectinomycin phosphotransferase